jgi:hypothetical protein
LKNLIFECVDNIRQHTDQNTNSYFCLYHDPIHKKYKLIVFDDYSYGFLNTYKDTLKNELKDLTSKLTDDKISKEIKSGYSQDFKTLSCVKSINEYKHDTTILKKMFDEKGAFQTHQIPHLIMHFGITTIINVINKVQGNFNIRLHRKLNDDNCLHYQINKTDNEIKEPSIHGMHGTHIYLEIPDNVEYKTRQPQPLHLKKTDYQIVLENENIIKDEIKHFTPINDLDNSSYKIFDFKKFYTRYPNKSIGDFFRELYFQIYDHNVLDALVINFPIKKYEIYLQNLVYILFSRNLPNLVTPANVIFFNASSIDIFFLGGKNYSEYIASNRLISKHYGHYGYQISDILLDEQEVDKVAPVKSKFFYETTKDTIVLPFELYGENKEISIERLIIQNLKENKHPLHVDVGKGYHISNFYKFDLIFKDSRFVKRIAYKFKNYLDNKETKKFKFIGIGKYANLLLATLHEILDKELNDSYLIINDFSNKDEKINLKEYIQEHHQNYTFVIVTPVAFDGELIKTEITDRYNDITSFIWLNTIQLILEGEEEKFFCSDYYCLVKYPISKQSYFKLNSKDGCRLCKSNEEEPLYKLSKSDYFSLQYCYFGSYQKKDIKAYSSVKDVKWGDSIYFGHVKRDNNHYVYYTKSLDFFYNNFTSKNDFNIKSFFENKVKKDIDKFIAKQASEIEIVIMTPMHGTHNKFLTKLNSMVFAGKATILQFNQSKGDDNIFRDDKEKYKNAMFFYADDEISSGSTIEYFHSILKTLKPNVGFSGIIVMIDRMMKHEEQNLIHYIDRDITDPYKHIFMFTKLEIKPIKTTKFEECFLCKRKEEYEDIINKTVLDINRFQIAHRIRKLKLIDYSKVDFFQTDKEKGCFSRKNFEHIIKNYIKMVAVDFVYENFEGFIFASKARDYNTCYAEYEEIENAFSNKIFKSIRLRFDHDINTSKLLRDICLFESSIALIKALSFPKLVYFEAIRYLATVAIITKILKELQKPPLETYLNIEKLETLILLQQSDHAKSFLKAYKSKLNIHYINFLYITAGYLNIHNILKIEHIEYFYQASIDVEAQGYSHMLLQPYQIATKMVSMYSIDKSKYFDKQISLFFKNTKEEINYNNHTLIDALLLENNLLISHKISNFASFEKALINIVESDKQIQEKMDQCSTYIKEVLNNNLNKNEQIEIEHIYINENIHTKYNDFEQYISSISLIDIVNDFKELNEKHKSHIERIVKGALSEDKENAMILERDSNTNEVKGIDNTWANEYVEDFFTNDIEKKCLIVKLVDVDIHKLNNTLCPKAIDNLWYKPIGCLVISFDGEKENYLNIVKIILSLQKNLVDFFKEEFSHETFREILKSKDREESIKKMQSEHVWQISSIHHSFKDYIKLEDFIDEYLKKRKNKPDTETFLKYISYYSYGLHHLSSLVMVKPQSGIATQSIDICDSLNTYSDDSFYTGMQNFIATAYWFMKNKNTSLTLETLDISELQMESLVLDLEEGVYMSHICFEFIFNALKYIPKDIENPKIIFRSLQNKTGVEIINNIDSSISIEKIKKSISTKKRVGLSLINDILEEQNYVMNFKIVDSKLHILITKRIENE